MNSSIRLANSIIRDRHLEAAAVRAARKAQRSTPSSSPLLRLIDFATASLRPTAGSVRTADLQRTNASTN